MLATSKLSARERQEVVHHSATKETAKSRTARRHLFDTHPPMPGLCLALRELARKEASDTNILARGFRETSGRGGNFPGSVDFLSESVRRGPSGVAFATWRSCASRA